MSAQTVMGKVAGLDKEELTASRRAMSSDPKVAAALQFARTLVERRGEMGDADVERARKVGYTDGEIAEIIAHVALSIFTKYSNKAAEVDVDFTKVAVRADNLRTAR